MPENISPDELGQLLENLDLVSYYFSYEDLLVIFPNGRHIADKFLSYEGNLPRLFKGMDSENRRLLSHAICSIFLLVNSGAARYISEAIEIRRGEGWAHDKRH